MDLTPSARQNACNPARRGYNVHIFTSDAGPRFPTLAMLDEIPADQFAAALDQCAADVLWEAGVAAPPVDAALVAERLGLVVTHNDALACRGRLVELADPRGSATAQGTIVVGPAERPERLQWAVAHEIGESIAYRVFAALGVRPGAAPENAREAVANHLAGCLLLPRAWFAADGPRLDWDLFALKQRYATASHELIARRMLEMPPPIVVTLCDQGRIGWRRTNADRRPPPMLPAESQAWQKAHRSGTPAQAEADPAATGLESIRAWPIHEPEWKREILRTCNRPVVKMPRRSRVRISAHSVPTKSTFNHGLPSTSAAPARRAAAHRSRRGKSSKTTTGASTRANR